MNKITLSLIIMETMMTLCPHDAWAQTQPENGDGSESNPYQITSDQEMLWFANQVNAGYYTANAKVMNDIDFSSSALATPMIGTSQYSGTFDGNGHKITVSINRTEEEAALFGKLYGTVKNLTVAGTITTSARYAAGICARSYGGKITCCTSLVDIKSNIDGDGSHGGICAVANEGVTIDNCVFAGKIEQDANTTNTTKNCGGLIGWASSSSTISNSLMIGDITVSPENSYTISRNPGNATITNCYYKTAFGTVNSGATQVNDAQLASGEIAYMLNGSKSEGAWGQNTTSDPKDAVPVIGGPAVYQFVHAYTVHHDAVNPTCTETGTIEYWECTACRKMWSKDACTNEVTDIEVPALGHNYVDYKCTRCGTLTQNDNGTYLINSASDLVWLGNFVNAGNDQVNAELLADIDFSSSALATPMIGTSKYSGTFDGNGHKITVCINRTEEDAALFDKLYGTVKNLTVAGTITTSAKYAAGICAHSYAGTITGCTSLVDIKCSTDDDGTHGGICAVADNGVTISNCLFAGKIEQDPSTTNETNRCGGIIGWACSGTTISNCLMLGDITISSVGSYTITRNPTEAKITNCYYKTAFGTVNSGAVQVNDAQITSGEVTYMLNGSTNTGDMAWGQNLEKQSIPQITGEGVHYARTMSNNWGTLVLPYDVAYTADNSDCKFYYLSSASTDELLFTEYKDGTIKAGTPVAVEKQSGDGIDIRPADKPGFNTTITPSSTVTEWTMHGTYSALNNQTGMYFIAQNRFWKANEPITLNPYRAWFETSATSLSKVMTILVDEGEATNVLRIENEDMKAGDSIYNLQGQRLSVPQPGQVNIINGNKIFVR